MKKLLLLILFCPAGIGYAQEMCKILHLNTPTINIGGKELRKGDSFDAQAQIFWDENKKQLMKFCYDDCTKHRIVSSDAFKETQSTSMKDYLFSRGQLSSRSGILNSVRELQNYFGRTVGLVNQIKVNIGKAFPMSESCFFYIRYIYQEEEVNKRLKNDKSNLILDTDIYMVDGQSIAVHEVGATLFYFDSEKMESTEITDKLVIFPINGKDINEWLNAYNARDLNHADQVEMLSEYLELKYPQVYFKLSDLNEWLLSSH